MTDTASRILAVLQAHPGSPAWRLAGEAGIAVNLTGVALRQLLAAGLARRGRNEHAITIWSAVERPDGELITTNGRGS